MSSSDPNSKIDFLDAPEVVKKKISKAFCEEGNITDNGILSFLEAVIIPISETRVQSLPDLVSLAGVAAPKGTVFTIDRPEKYGGPSHYTSFTDLQADFRDKKIHPGDLKAAATIAITKLLEPIQTAFAANIDWQKIEKLAYPDPKDLKVQKKKKVSTTMSCMTIKFRQSLLQDKGIRPPAQTRDETKLNDMPPASNVTPAVEDTVSSSQTIVQ